MSMTNAKFKLFVLSLEDIFASLYLRDVGSMTGKQKLEHQKFLNAAYIAMLRAQNQELTNLNEQAKAKAAILAEATLAMQKQLVGLKKVSQVLEIVGQGLNILSSVATLFA